MAGLGEGDRQVEGRRGLGDSALLVGERDHLGPALGLRGRDTGVGDPRGRGPPRRKRIVEGDPLILVILLLVDGFGDWWRRPHLGLLHRLLDVVQLLGEVNTNVRRLLG